MHKTIYMQDAVYEMAKAKAHTMGVSISRLVQTAIEKLAGEDERTKAMREMFAVAESGEFANDFKDFDEWLKVERKASDREFL